MDGTLVDTEPLWEAGEAARRAGVPIDQCLIFEDSTDGLAAAHASRAYVWNLKERPLATIGAHDVGLDA